MFLVEGVMKNLGNETVSHLETPQNFPAIGKNVAISNPFDLKLFLFTCIKIKGAVETLKKKLRQFFSLFGFPENWCSTVPLIALPSIFHEAPF
jgi:hypothetical protein